jgi:hypothetical protein
VTAGTSVLGQSGGVAIGHADYVAVTPAQPQVASQPVRLAPRPVFLAGREQLLADLDAQLSGGGLRIVALYGLGGAGKTSVAAAGARDQYAALLPIFERVLGPEHPDTLTSRANLARWAAAERSGARPDAD